MKMIAGNRLYPSNADSNVAGGISGIRSFMDYLGDLWIQFSVLIKQGQ